MTMTLHGERVAAMQCALQEMNGLDGWLFYDFRGSDPLAYRVLLLDPGRHVTRRWYYWIPATGAPVKLLHRIEPHVLDELPGEAQRYVSWEQQRALLSSLLRNQRRISMQYSPFNAVPYLARVDAGTIDLIRSFGLDVVTSADLVQRFEAVWTDCQLESHRYATEALRRIVDDAFAQALREAVVQLHNEPDAWADTVATLRAGLAAIAATPGAQVSASAGYYAATAARVYLRENQPAEAAAVIELGLRSNPLDPELAYLLRVMERRHATP